LSEDLVVLFGYYYISANYIIISVSNIGNTETGFSGIRDFSMPANTGKILPVLPVLERIKWAFLTKIITF
jgi:hypothetical protein